MFLLFSVLINTLKVFLYRFLLLVAVVMVMVGGDDVVVCGRAAFSNEY